MTEDTYQWCDIVSVNVVHGGDESLYSVELMTTHSHQLLLCPDHSLFLRNAEKVEDAIASFLNINT